jgi:hypothetical protein
VWLVGVAFLLLLTSSLCVFVGRRPSQSSAEIWDIPGTSRTYTTVVGALAGFSVTSSIFIANLTVARQSAAFESIIALFLIAFLVFISSAMQFATTPNLAVPAGELYRTVQGYSYVLANASFYLGLSLSWLGLPLLLAAIDLEYLSDAFIWMVLFAILGGAMRISSSGLNTFSQVELKAGLALPILCFATAGVYHLAGTEVIDDLLPARHGPTVFAVLCFVAAAVGFSLQSMIVGALGRESASVFVARWGRAVLIAFTAAVFTCVSLLWLEVASEVP